VVWFTDRPERHVGQLAVTDFVASWNELGFRADPPNAVLTLLHGNRKADTVALKLSHPRYDATHHTLRYAASRLRHATGSLSDYEAKTDRRVPRRFNAASVFIDGSDNVTVPPGCTMQSMSVDCEMVDLSDLDLSGDDLFQARLVGANFTGANLTGANLTGANLAGATLTGANLTGAYLAGAVLAGAYAAGANLTGATLTGAYLVEALMPEARLDGANLTDANLNGAHLEGVDLSNATLTGADITGAFLDHARWCNTTLPDGGVSSASCGVE